jgi:hypothetical protein
VDEESYIRGSFMIMIMSMGRDYVSELRPSTGLLFMRKAIHEHGEPWWNVIDRVKLVHHSYMVILPAV